MIPDYQTGINGGFESKLASFIDLVVLNMALPRRHIPEMQTFSSSGSLVPGSHQLMFPVCNFLLGTFSSPLTPRIRFFSFSTPTTSLSRQGPLESQPQRWNAGGMTWTAATAKTVTEETKTRGKWRNWKEKWRA